MKRLLFAAALGAALVFTVPVVAAPHFITALGMVAVDPSLPAPPPEAALGPVALDVPVPEVAPAPVTPPEAPPCCQRPPDPRFIGPPVRKP